MRVIQTREARTRVPERDERTWADGDPPEETCHLSPDSATQARRAEGMSDELLGHYFADVRQHALLTRAEETALWRQITSALHCSHRALYMSPVGLPTLMRLWHQVKQGETPVAQVISEAGTTGSLAAVTHRQLPQNVACRFPAPRSSADASQHSILLQSPIRQMKLRTL